MVLTSDDKDDGGGVVLAVKGGGDHTLVLALVVTSDAGDVQHAAIDRVTGGQGLTVWSPPTHNWLSEAWTTQGHSVTFIVNGTCCILKPFSNLPRGSG